MNQNLHTPARDDVPRVAFGMVSLVLGTIGLLLFLLPVLGIPLGVCGLLFGVAGVAAAGLGAKARLRWSIAGIVVSLVTIGVGVALAAAPIGFGPSYAVPRLWQMPPDRPQVPPPALPGRW